LIGWVKIDIALPALRAIATVSLPLLSAAKPHPRETSAFRDRRRRWWSPGSVMPCIGR